MLSSASYSCESSSQYLKVTATAYTSSAGETNDSPTITAWGDVLKPGMNVIAVSRDLIALGLDHGAVVSIKGFKKEFIVADKMNKRWEKKIDIYMGNNKQAAKEWGKQKVTICW